MSPPPSVRQFLEDQHALLELQLAALERCLRAGAFRDARRRLGGFRAHLDRYVRAEERLLFPVYDRVAAPTARSTETMRREHARLGRLVVELGRLVVGEDAPGGLVALGTLRSLLFVHGAKESWVIYPRVAGALSPSMEQALVSDLRTGVPLAS